MNPTDPTSARAANQAEPDAKFEGLQQITSALAEVIGYRVDLTTTYRWMRHGIRGHRLAGRRVGRRWLCSKSAMEAFARASGALPEGEP